MFNKVKNKTNLLLSAVFLTIATIYGILIKELSAENALYPKFILYLLIGLTIILVVQSMLGEDIEENIFKDFDFKQFGQVFISGIAYIFAINIVGYFTSTFAFLILLFILLKNNKKVLIITSIIFTIFLYFVFKIFLNVPVPTGIFI